MLKLNKDSFKVVTGSTSIIGKFEGKSADVVMNNNEMILGPDLWRNVHDSEEYKRGIELGHYIGFLGHPEDPGCQDFKNACIILRGFEIDDNTNEINASFDLVDTPVGQIVKTFIDAGVQFGISVRGAGDIDADGVVDPDTFVFRGFDLVAFPAYNDAIPTFTEIAASSDLDKQVKCKAVKSCIRKNVSGISSVSTIEALQDQVVAASSEYTLLEKRKQEILNNPDDNSVTSLKLQGMTRLYLESIEANKQLQKQLDEVKASENSANNKRLKSERELKVVKRIMGSQITDLSSDRDNIYGKYQTAVKANAQLKSQLEDVNNLNLKYIQKVNSSTAAIRDKTKTIAQLEVKLRETFTASDNSKRASSNLDAKVANLERKLSAATKLVEEYQQSYIELYSLILGVNLDSVQVTASTSANELKELIQSGTSTSNVASRVVDSYPEDLDMDIGEDDLVTV